MQSTKVDLSCRYKPNLIGLWCNSKSSSPRCLCVYSLFFSVGRYMRYTSERMCVFALEYLEFGVAGGHVCLHSLRESLTKIETCKYKCAF
jgi:hypothetical protein